MRLLHCGGAGGYHLTEPLPNDNTIPRYAILSHTWGADSDEVTEPADDHPRQLDHRRSRLQCDERLSLQRATQRRRNRLRSVASCFAPTNMTRCVAAASLAPPHYGLPRAALNEPGISPAGCSIDSVTALWPQDGLWTNRQPESCTARLIQISLITLR